MAQGEGDKAEAWWRAWWEEDYSWDGLAAKQIVGGGTLQDYWRAEEGALLPAPGGKARFTRFHLPFVWADGAPTGKADWSGEKIAAFRAEIQARLAAARETEVDYLGQVEGADGRAQFAGVIFPAGIFAGSPTTQATTQEGEADSRPIFHIQAQRAWFAGGANWRGARFGPGARFESASFAGLALFESASFGPGARFNNASFAGDAWFQSASFAGDAWFHSASFAGVAGFESASFAGDAMFDSASFANVAWFDGSSFAGNAGFYSASFAGDARFDSAVFGGDARFQGEGAQMQGEGASDLLPIARRAFPSIDAQAAVFFGSADFSNRDILAPSSFKQVVFLGLAAFHGSRLHQGVSFQGADFDAALAPEQAEIKGAIRVRFDKAVERLHQVERMRRQLKGEPAIELKPWRREFEKKRAERAKKFRKQSEDERSQRYEEVESAFRTLKLAMEENRDRVMEGHFFQRELMARRKRRDALVPLWERVFSDFYRASSSFGASVILPLWWLAAMSVAFALLYWVWAGGAMQFDPGLFDALRYSASRMFPFGAFGGEPSSYGAGFARFLADGDGLHRLLLGFCATVQSTMAIALLFLFALAVRRRFQIS